MKDEPQPDKPNAALNAALTALQWVDRAVDLRWLAEELREWNVEGYRAKLNGIKGGHEFYPRSTALYAAYDAAATLSAADKHTLALVVNMLYRLMQPKPDEARGTVQLKTIIKWFPVIDWAATGEGAPVYVLDDNGEPETEAHPYTYAYIRQYASKGDTDRKGAKLLSIYADRGMGKGGSGGYVAAALNAELVSQDDILDAWHAGRDTYHEFSNHCADLLRDTGEIGQDDERPNSDAPSDERYTTSAER